MTENPKTVGELIACLQEFPPNMRLFRPGNTGNFNEGVNLQVVALAQHNHELDFYGDMKDRIWQRVRSTFGKAFAALVI